MLKTLYVVRLGKRLYLDSDLYMFYQSTTPEITHAHFFDDYNKAYKLAKKAHGEVIELYLMDNDEFADLKNIKEEAEMAKKEAQIAKDAFRKVLKANNQ